jgi:hypothetical protein
MPPTPAPLLRAGLASLLVLAAASCGGVNGGSEPFAGTTRFVDPGGTYELRLLEPPWVPLMISGQRVFVVPPTDVVSTSATEADALYSLHIAGVQGDPRSALAVAAAALPGVTTSAARDVDAVSGAEGVEVSWQEAPTVFHRDAFLGAPAGPTFLMHFTAKKAIADDSMVTQMILSFAPRVAVANGLLP